MLLHVFLWTFEYLHNRGRNFLRSTNPLCLHSEFPRSFLVSAVLIALFIILICLFGQILDALFSQLGKNNPSFNNSNVFYFAAYMLANLLFLAHLGLYFGYRENVTLDSDTLRIRQGLFKIQWIKQIPLDNVFFHHCCQSSMGNYHVEVYYHDAVGRTKKVQLGAYLDEIHLEMLTHSFDRVYSDKTLAVAKS